MMSWESFKKIACHGCLGNCEECVLEKQGKQKWEELEKSLHTRKK